MNVDDPYCVEVMELSAVPFLSCSFSPLTFPFHSSLPHFELRKLGGSYLLLTICLPSPLKYYAFVSVDEELKGRKEGDGDRLCRGIGDEDGSFNYFVFKPFRVQDSCSHVISEFYN